MYRINFVKVGLRVVGGLVPMRDRSGGGQEGEPLAIPWFGGAFLPVESKLVQFSRWRLFLRLAAGGKTKRYKQK